MTNRIELAWADGFTATAVHDDVAFSASPWPALLHDQEAQREWLRYVLVKLMQDMLRQQRTDWQVGQLEFQRQMQNEMMRRARRSRERERDAQRDKINGDVPTAHARSQDR
jgi:hypothetical protein